MVDIISEWNYGEEELKEFLEHLNCLGGGGCFKFYC